MTNIDSSGLFIARLKIGANYPSEAFQACDIEKSHIEIAEIMQVTNKKGFDNLVELKIRRTSKGIASKCAVAISSYIKNLEENLKKSFVLDAKQRIVEYNQEIQSLEKVMIRSDGSTIALPLGYLSTRDELIALRRQIKLINQFIKMSSRYPTKLLSPIVVSDSPVLPKKGFIGRSDGRGNLRIFVGDF